MLAWLVWRLDRLERIHAVAGALMSEFGPEAYSEARRREREAPSEARARDWRRVATIVGRRMLRRAGVDPGAEGPFAGPASLADGAEPFQIQFVCGTLEEGATNVTEKPIRAADSSAAIIAAASTKWPRRTIGLRILDRERREVFAREARRAEVKEKAAAP